MAPEKIATITTVPPFKVMSDSYKAFIDKVRVALAGTKPAPATVEGPTSKVARPVLAKETAPDKQPPRWIHIELQGKNSEAPKVAIRSDNAYIIGFTNSKGKWYQLSKTGSKDKLVDDKPLMAGFDGNYNTLIGGVNNLPSLNLNNFSLAKAAATLWNKASLSGNDDVNADDNEEEETAMLRANDPVKEAVATLAVAVCEAARFIPVSDVISEGWTQQRVSVTTKEVNYIKEWGDLSSALLSWKNKKYKDETFFDQFKSIGISNGEQALAVVGLVKLVIRSNMAVTTGYMASTPTDEQLLAYAELPKHGRYMAEVLAVRIPAIAGGNPPSGTISFHGGHYCSDFIYSWSPSEEHTAQQTCDSQGNIVLTGPSVATSAYGPIVISLDLQESSRGQAEDGEEEEENTGRIVCDTVCGDFSQYNRVISETVPTGYGPAEVIYAVLSNGVQARVDVKLAGLQSGDEEDIVILGKIIAHSKLFDVGSVLFYNESDKGVQVQPGELVPLARQALAVPLHMPLTIELDLRHCSGDEIVRGQLEFQTAMDGLKTERLVGVNGAEFEVTIAWSEYPW